jgi:hypothetical protein|tara:strand:- start:237 stop:623 length:387 start_codon:yes stop_codon:yes gene_type:complete
MAGISPTQRTLKAMRNQGRICGIVEKFQQYGGKFGIRQDLFGFIDIIAIDSKDGIIAIQSTGQDWSGHINKIMDLEEIVMKWLEHAPLELWSWRKVKKVRGGKAMIWKARIGDFYIENKQLKYKERDE